MSEPLESHCQCFFDDEEEEEKCDVGIFSARIQF
jgi:hypothetical protein